MIYAHYVYIREYIHIYEGCSKFFHLENAIFAKKNSFAELSRTPYLSFAVHVGQDFEEKHECVTYPQIVPGV